MRLGVGYDGGRLEKGEDRIFKFGDRPKYCRTMDLWTI
jgi:hypothetical protein